LGKHAKDLFFDPGGGAGVGGVQRVIDLLAGDVVLDPPDALLSPLEDGGHDKLLIALGPWRLVPSRERRAGRISFRA
jgi:hypothetical protein